MTRNQNGPNSFSMVDGEEKLIRSAIRGESSAFGRLYDHYQPKIYRFVFVKVGRREEAEDLTHQVFLQAWTKIASYRDLGFPFSSWLYRIARNIVIDHYRTKKEEVRLDAMDPEYFVSQANVQFAVDRDLALGQVKQAIRTLRPEYQDVIVMRFVEELSLKEVAATLEKSEGAVKLLQHRAIEALRKKLSLPPAQ